MKRLLLSILFVAMLATVPAQATPTPANATEAVFYAQGVADVQPLLALPTYSLRLMAMVNRALAERFAEQGYTLGVFYFTGRADAFNAMADLLGEP